jgi:hypothetical protein
MEMMIMAEKARDYKQEYRDYRGKPEQIKERAQCMLPGRRWAGKWAIPARLITKSQYPWAVPTALETSGR